MSVDKLPEEINEMKIRDDKAEKEMEATAVDGNGTETGHIIVTTIGGKNGQLKQTISCMAERIVGQGSFGIVFQFKCLETRETVANLQSRRSCRIRDIRTVNCKLCAFSITPMLFHSNTASFRLEKEELYLNLVLEYVPETVYGVSRHYSKANQRMPMIYVKLYTYQVNPHTHQLKLCDFGSAKALVKGDPNISYICSCYYRAPELIFGATECTTAIDIWSVVVASLLNCFLDRFPIVL